MCVSVRVRVRSGGRACAPACLRARVTSTPACVLVPRHEHRSIYRGETERRQETLIYRQNSGPRTGASFGSEKEPFGFALYVPGFTYFTLGSPANHQ